VSVNVKLYRNTTDIILLDGAKYLSVSTIIDALDGERVLKRIMMFYDTNYFDKLYDIF